jgi:hypothetical protein
MSASGPKKTDVTAPKSNFRFNPESGLRADIAPCPFRAANKPTYARLFDHLVGAGKRCRRDGEAERQARPGKVSSRNSNYSRFWEAAVGLETRFDRDWAGRA